MKIKILKYYIHNLMKIEFDNKNKYNFTGNVLSCICFIFN